ncbi:D-alanyl-D-alanine carboxypeptidase [Thermaurantimonas aggregans]|uniref:D-alanyl-D-alanine carboxypeptidase n=1 Tax=Thermaurantimonas aggregans TaxID=2173829 RepID=A0A401XNA9_9FLAO|nr:M15 family metallopeptidase [Thermaurantimonas aggregans]MCX8149616.1 M15 family metallopeptidase [Thermaurantimonas aggregans]GCD78499.1 D-alanyl-D-alanine carboxypeptidase [Thermaurantimonas aggregans]
MRVCAIIFFFIITTLGHSQYTKEELLGRFDPETHSDFVRIKTEYANHPNHYLRKEVAEAFYKMAQAAQRDGITLTIVSSTRNYARQKTIWENKYHKFAGTPFDRVHRILQYSSMPGTSRHHWGTDFDLNSVDPEYFNTPAGQRVYKWLRENAWKYGFFQPYTSFDDTRSSGYFEEKWHWSYKPLADLFLWAYRLMVSYDDIYGFSGAEIAKSLNVIDNYVLSILPEER